MDNIKDNVQSTSFFKLPEYAKIISLAMIKEIRKVDYFQRSQYRDLEIVDTLLFYTNRFVRQLYDFSVVNDETVIVDVGAGFGWLSMAFAFSTQANILAIETNEARLNAGKQIADILCIGNKINWRIGNLGKLPLDNKVADAVYCIEVLEHVHGDSMAIYDLCRVSNDLVILTTPNKWFPIIAHDTQLPFCHWFPIPLRKIYAKLFDYKNRENGNLFWSPLSLQKNMKEFKPISNWLHYKSLDNYIKTFPCYLPYRKGKYISKIGNLQKMYYNIISKFGIYSHYLTPSLSYVFKRNGVSIEMPSQR
jgi:ubiquinone/menaquinone biosynthesis C-methylase UbiE